MWILTKALTLDIILFQYCSIVTSVYSSLKISNEEFLEQLFKGYSKYMLPIKDINTPVNMSISWLMISLNDVDTKQKTVSVTVILEMKWVDEYLRWNNTGEYGAPSKISIDSNSIWLPDLIIGNEEGILTFLTADDIKNVIVLKDGNISAYPYRTFEVGVDSDIYKYPFDTQEIALELTPWTYSSSELVISDKTNVNDSSVVFNQFRGNGEWDLASWSRETYFFSYENTSLTYSAVTVKFIIKRRWVYAIFNLVAPVVLTSLLNPLSFLLPVDSGERITLSNTVFLTLAVFFTIVSNSLPQTSEGAPIFVTYIGLQMFGSVLTIAFTILSLACYYNKSKLCKNKKCHVLCNTCDHSKTEIQAENNIVKHEENNLDSIKPKDVGKIWSNVIDRACFWISLLWNVSLISITIIIAIS